MKPDTPRMYVGISGYTYPNWRGVFYPAGLLARRKLEYASRQFNSIELNSTFYSLKSPAVYQKWYADTPDGFLFAIKGSRFTTHNLKLRNVDVALGNFLASGVFSPREKTGPFLCQLRATYGFDAERVNDFPAFLAGFAADATATSTSTTTPRYSHRAMRARSRRG